MRVQAWVWSLGMVTGASAGLHSHWSMQWSSTVVRHSGETKAWGGSDRAGGAGAFDGEGCGRRLALTLQRSLSRLQRLLLRWIPSLCPVDTQNRCAQSVVSETLRSSIMREPPPRIPLPISALEPPVSTTTLDPHITFCRSQGMVRALVQSLALSAALKLWSSRRSALSNPLKTHAHSREYGPLGMTG